MTRFLEVRRHTMRDKPGPNINQAGVTLARRVGETMGQFDLVVTSTVPRAFQTAIAMGYAVQRQQEVFSTMGAAVDAEIHWEDGFPAWGHLLRELPEGAAAGFVRQQAAALREIITAVPEGGAALVISHGGVVEAGIVGCLPQADHAAWGRYCDYCEGARLEYDQGVFRLDTLYRLA